jgi:hypothetical protein
MSFVAAGTFVIGAEAAVALGAVGTGLIGGALVGAGTGALVNGLSGRSVLNGALIGGAIGGVGGALGGAFAGGELAGGIGEMATADASSQIAAGIPAAQVSTTLQTSYGLTAAQANAITASAASTGTTASTALNAASAANTVNNAASQTPVSAGNTQIVPPVSNPQTLPTDSGASQIPQPSTGPYASMSPDQWSKFTANTTPQEWASYNTPAVEPSGIKTYANKALDWVGNNKALTAAGLGAAYLATRPNAFKPNYLPQYTPPTAQSYGLGATLSPNYKPTFAAAQGGIASLTKHFDEGGTAQSPIVPPAYGGLTAAGVSGLQPKAAAPSTPLTMDYIQSLAGQYGVSIPSNMLPANAAPKYAHGGNVQSNLGGYSDGGRLLKGPGDGMSDNIPASIANKQPARLAEGEFVVPADVVSHLGNGSTDAGAKHLYKMMDNVRKARTGRKAQGKQIKAGKYLPA